MNAREKIEFGGCGWSERADFFSEHAADGKFARPGSKPSYAPDQALDTEHLRLELELNIPAKTLTGKCTTTFRAIIDGAKEVQFDAVGMKVLSVTSSSGQKLRHNYHGEKLTVHLRPALQEGEEVTIAIRYLLSKPIAGVYFVGPDRFYPKKPVQVWTHGEAEESRYWFPCFDAPHDKATTEMIATVPKDFFALSNGALIEVKENPGRKTKSYHWRQAIPHSPYLVTLVAGKFSEIKDEWDGIPILYYCAPGREKDTQRAFGKTPKMVQFFSEKIGVRYPYEKYAQIAVADFVMGGMEHTTATTQTDRVLMDERAYPEFTADWLVSHELAHQWFGDLVTCKEWSHAWLNESFATYFEALFTEHDLGKDEFDYEMLEKLNSYLDEEKKVYRRAIVTNIYRKPDDLFDRHLYEKGALVLHMLRHELGEKLFWKAIRHYVETFQRKAVETSDLINAIQESTGRNMRKFFDQWVYHSGKPDYTVHYWWDPAKKRANVQVQQKPGEGGRAFSIPVQIEFLTGRGGRGKKVFRELIENKKHQFHYRFKEEPIDIRFDPEHVLLKTAQVTKPYRMWIRQLQSDPHAVGRIEAAKEIAKVATDESCKALIRAFTKEKFWGTAREIAVAIGSMRLAQARDFLVRALHTKNPKVRRGVVEALAQFQDRRTVSKLAERFHGEKSYFVGAESLKSMVKNRASGAERWIRQSLARESWNDTIRAAGVQALAQIPTAESIGLLQKFSRYGFHPACRGSAVQGLAKCARSFPELFSDLISLTGDRQVRVKHAAISALGDLREPRAIPALEKISKDKTLPYRSRALAEDALLKISPKKEDFLL